MGVRLEPHDEYTHEVGPESTWQESMYTNACDPTSGVAAFFRVGNRPNEGRGEVTVCIYRPDGTVDFLFARPEVADNERLAGAGLAFDVIEPFRELRVTFRGKAVHLEQPLDLADPRAAFTSNPWHDAEAEVVLHGMSPMFGGEPDEAHERPGEEFAKAHYEQLVRTTGAIRVGDEEWALDGHGLRDHSWGPRTWQAPWYYRWLTCAGDGFGAMVSRIARRDGDGTRGGFVWEGGDLILCDRAEVATTWTDDHYQAAVAATLTHSATGRSWTLDGKVRSMVPLRNRREAPDGTMAVTRIAEGLTEWTFSGGRTTLGLAEYLDQLIDGRPVGAAE